MEIWCLAVLYFGLLLLQQTENFHNSRNDLWPLESRILVWFNLRWILTTVNVRGFIMLDYLPFWKLILNSLGCLLLKRPGSIRVLGNPLSNFDSILGTLMHQCHVRTGMYPASVTDRTLGLSQQCSFLPREGGTMARFWCVVWGPCSEPKQPDWRLIPACSLSSPSACQWGQIVSSYGIESKWVLFVIWV